MLNYPNSSKWNMINTDFFVRIYKFLNNPIKTTKASSGSTFIINELLNEYIEKYKTEFDYIQENVKYIDQIALYQGSKIFTNFTVNIQEHFVPKIKTFISNLIIKKQESLVPENMLKKDWIKVLQARSRLVQKIILENIKDYNELNEYELTIVNLLGRILPETIEKNSVIYDVHITEKYFEPYYKLGLLYQQHQLKQFNVFPLSTSTIPRHIRFDTFILIKVVLGLGNEITKGTLNVEDNLEEIWNKLFNLKKKPFKPRNGKVFSGSIETDGVSITICLEDIITHNKKKNRKGKKRKKPEEEKTISKKEFSKPKIKKEVLPSEYFQDNIIKENHVYIDPNKRDLLYCLGMNGEKLRYTQMQRRHETKSKKYQKIRKDLEEENECLPKENVNGKNGLRNQNIPIPSRKLLDPIAFRIYLKDYLYRFTQLELHYKNTIFRKLKLNAFINSQKSETKFIKKFKEKFGDNENTTVLIGDWSRTAMKYQVPTKGKGFRDMFKKAGYQVCLVNEFLTSSICPGCKSRSLEKFKERQHPNPTKKDKLIKVHGLLRCKNEMCKQMVNGNLVERLWNRDDVATLNLKDVVEATLLHGVRPNYLSR